MIFCACSKLVPYLAFGFFFLKKKKKKVKAVTWTKVVTSCVLNWQCIISLLGNDTYTVRPTPLCLIVVHMLYTMSILSIFHLYLTPIKIEIWFSANFSHNYLMWQEIIGFLKEKKKRKKKKKLQLTYNSLPHKIVVFLVV